MKLTRLGQEVVLFAVIVLLGCLLVGAAWLGQHWKQERIEQQQEVTHNEVG